MKKRSVLVWAAMLLSAACGSGPGDGSVSDARGGEDGAVGGSLIPGWQLEDVQPASPRVGQTYGLEAFSSHIVVVTLVEGF